MKNSRGIKEKVSKSVFYSRVLLYNTCDTLQHFGYIPGTIWTTEHLTDTLTFKDRWPYDLHDLAERLTVFVRILNFQDVRGERIRLSDDNVCT